MLKKFALLVFLIICLTLLISYDKKQGNENRAFDKGTAVWHD